VLRIGRSKAYELTTEWERSGGRSGLPFIWIGRQKRVPREAIERMVRALLGPDAA
jgi:glutaredoxin